MKKTHQIQKYSRARNKDILGAAGLRTTNQRSLILDIIREGKGHLDADEVHEMAKEKQPRISLSTVYRTLQKLKKMGLIEELHFDEAHHHYELKPSIEHHHITCMKCGKVTEFEYPLTEILKTNVPEAGGFDITQIELNLAGYCPECKDR